MGICFFMTEEEGFEIEKVMLYILLFVKVCLYIWKCPYVFDENKDIISKGISYTKKNCTKKNYTKKNNVIKSQR